MSFRRLKTIKIPIPSTQEATAVIHGSIRPLDLNNPPEKLRRELQVPQTKPHTVVVGTEEKKITIINL